MNRLRRWHWLMVAMAIGLQVLADIDQIAPLIGSAIEIKHALSRRMPGPRHARSNGGNAKLARAQQQQLPIIARCSEVAYFYQRRRIARLADLGHIAPIWHVSFGRFTVLGRAKRSGLVLSPPPLDGRETSTSCA